MAAEYTLDNKKHERKNQKKDVPAKPGVQRYCATIWLADDVQHETKDVSTSLVWAHALGERVNEAIYFVQVGSKYIYLQPYVPVSEMLRKVEGKKVHIRGFRPDDPTMPLMTAEEKTSRSRQRYNDVEAEDVDAKTLSPETVTLIIEHPCNGIEHTWPEWKLEQNEFLSYVAKLVCKRKVYGDKDQVALNVCIDGVRMQIEGRGDKTMREGGFLPPVHAWVYREEKATLESSILNEVAASIRDSKDKSSGGDYCSDDSDIDESFLTLRKTKDKPKPKPEPTPHPTPHPLPQPKNQQLRLYLRLPTEEKVMEVVSRNTTIKQIKGMLMEQEDLDRRTKVTMTYQKAKLPDEITVQGAQLENDCILEVSYN